MKDILKLWLSCIDAEQLTDKVYDYLLSHSDIYHQLFDKLLERTIEKQQKLMEKWNV